MYKISARTKCLQQHAKFKSHYLFSSAYAVYEFICLINLRLLLYVIVVQRVDFLSYSPMKINLYSFVVDPPPQPCTCPQSRKKEKKKRLAVILGF